MAAEEAVPEAVIRDGPEHLSSASVGQLYSEMVHVMLNL